MLKPLNKIIVLVFTAVCLFSIGNNAFANDKYDKWLLPSYFRGYNVIDEAPKTLQDFIDFKNYGGNFISINTRGFLSEDEPYGLVQTNIDGVDEFVDFCQQTGIYYSIAVRSGPGAYDTYYESQGWTPESRIWFTGNTEEQQLYADMLKMIVQRYNSDSLFVGITFVVEPRPKVRYIPANTSELYKTFLEMVYNIHMDEVYKFWVEQVRVIDPDIPIILENFAYSTPELFPPYEIVDNYIIYSVHNYQPVEYTRPEIPFTVNYPGVYWNLTYLSQRLYDSTFMANTVFGKLNEFAEVSGKPIFLGEFGMNKPQFGGPEYIKDVLGTVKNRGWHFALWEWRNGGEFWSIENFQGDNNEHWKAVLKQFNPPPVPVLNKPVPKEVITTLTPVFDWDSLTGFTSYDLMLSDDFGLIALFEDITTTSYLYDGPQLVAEKSYIWTVRSKNPGGMPENNSQWSKLRTFSVAAFVGINQNNNIPKEFNLWQNYPNPFNPVTIIKYEIPKNANVSVIVYDVTGRVVKELVNEFKYAGYYNIEFNAANLSSGVYYYRIISEYYTDTKKLVVIK